MNNTDQQIRILLLYSLLFDGIQQVLSLVDSQGENVLWK